MELAKTRLASMENEENKRKLTGGSTMDTWVAITGKRGRPPSDVVEFPSGPTRNQDRRYRVDALRLASVSEKGVVTEHDKW